MENSQLHSSSVAYQVIDNFLPEEDFKTITTTLNTWWELR